MLLELLDFELDERLLDLLELLDLFELLDDLPELTLLLLGEDFLTEELLLDEEELRVDLEDDELDLLLGLNAELFL